MYAKKYNSSQNECKIKRAHMELTTYSDWCNDFFHNINDNAHVDIRWFTECAPL